MNHDRRPFDPCFFTPSTNQQRRRDAGTHTEPKPKKKKRTQVELPVAIIDGDEVPIVLEVLSLPELAEYQQKWKQKLADVPRIEMQLRAIHANSREGQVIAINKRLCKK